MLKQQIKSDLTTALKAHDEITVSTLRMLLSSIQYFEIAKKGTSYEASDEEVISVIQKEAKKRTEAIELYKKGDRNELAEKEEKELAILQTYLPKQLSDEELTVIISDTIRELGVSDITQMGKVMAQVMPKVAGKTDGARVSKIVKEKLT